MMGKKGRGCFCVGVIDRDGEVSMGQGKREIYHHEYDSL